MSTQDFEQTHTLQHFLLAIKGNTALTLPKVLSSDVIAGIRYAVSTLEERGKKLLWLQYFELCTEEEIAEQLSIPPGEIHNLATASLRQLRTTSKWSYIQHGIEGYKKYCENRMYQKGYRDGYKTGHLDGQNGSGNQFAASSVPAETASLPIEFLGLSARAYHCLVHKGYFHIGDFVSLAEEDIVKIRNMGAKTIAEIRNALHKLGIYNTPWDSIVTD